MRQFLPSPAILGHLSSSLSPVDNDHRTPLVFRPPPSEVVFHRPPELSDIGIMSTRKRKQEDDIDDPLAVRGDTTQLLPEGEEDELQALPSDESEDEEE